MLTHRDADTRRERLSAWKWSVKNRLETDPTIQAVFSNPAAARKMGMNFDQDMTSIVISLILLNSAKRRSMKTAKLAEYMFSWKCFYFFPFRI